MIDKVGDVQLVSPNKSVCSWFELSKENSEYEVDGDRVSEKSVSPRSLLMVVDEALEFELCRLVEKEVGVPKQRFSLFEGDPEDDLEELTNKCFDSDLELNVPLKCLRGRKKKSPMIVLERKTRSRKPF